MKAIKEKALLRLNLNRAFSLFDRHCELKHWHEQRSEAISLIVPKSRRLIRRFPSQPLQLLTIVYFIKYITSLTAFTTLAGLGKYASINVGAYGNGTSPPITRIIGASK